MKATAYKNHAIHTHLVEICEQIARGNYEKAKELFDSPSLEQSGEVSRVLAEALAMMLLRVEAREFERDRMLVEISEAREELERHRGRLAEENKRLRAQVRGKDAARRLVGEVPAMRALRAQAERLAASRATVLILGETGSGKGLLARHIHDIGPRADKGYVDINCAAIPASLLESELFGIEAGVASGVQARMGRFEQANGGTLLLDEIGDMPLESQAKILHVIESGTVERIGGRKRIKVDVRLMAATHRDLAGLVKSGRFREDLYYRLNVMRLNVPPLRDRLEDIPALANMILGKLAGAAQDAPRRVSPEALRLLTRHHWPGNIRELHHVLERAQLFAEGPKISAADITASLQGGSLEQTASENSGEPTLDEVVAKYIHETLARHHGNKTLTAQILGISREGLRIKLTRRGQTPLSDD
ncbi:MAG: sigma-54 dependent transcriptional regulator [Candidatus Adiutrix sp.]|jgi:DNA-binding NtrC family response regulator|nr:sigma-54 dependent transcriptional regulator [Candidatus Adiutrix sp.]